MKTLRLLALLVLALACLAQTAPTQPHSAPPPPPPAATAHPQGHITPQQADELFRSVDQILKWVSEDTGLPIKHPVKRALASREQVEKYVTQRIEKDEDAQRLQRSEKVLKRLGLIPRNFDLRPFMVSLLKEQVAGYYNSEDQTVYLLDWVEPEQQKPILAHELTHALQDQNFGLDKFVKAALAGPDGNLNGDEREVARTAVVEGQGMVTLIDYVLAPLGKNIHDAPQLADAIQASMVSGANMQVFANAPLYLQNALLFPYKYGLTFERDLLVKRGKEAAFAGVFRNPPQDTRQVMEPGTYLAGNSVSPLLPPDFASALDGKYKEFDLGTLGEFDLNMLIRYAVSPANGGAAGSPAGAGVAPAGVHDELAGGQSSDPSTANTLAPNWRGAYYYAAQAQVATPDALPAVALVLRWKDADSASQFAGIYAAAIPQRYAGAQMTTPEATTDLENRTKAVQNAGLTIPISRRLTHPAAWTSPEGPLYVEPHGDTVLVMEGFDEQAAAKIRATVFPLSAK